MLGGLTFPQKKEREIVFFFNKILELFLFNKTHKIPQFATVILMTYCRKS